MQVNAVVAEIVRLRSARDGAKAVVFSTWTRVLTVLGAALAANKVPYASLASTRTQRSSSLDTFQTDPSCTVLLVTLTTLGEHHLTADGPAISKRDVPID